MLIDWFTVIAQIINFLILLFLLRRFLYGPIIAAMDKREQRVVSRLEEARQQQAEAEQAAEEYRRKQHELEQQRRSMLHEAEENAEQRQRELVAEAREEADRLRSNWRAALEHSKGSFLRDLRQRTGEQVLTIARRMLGDLADADLERQIVKVFLQRLRAIDQETRQTIQQALGQLEQAAVLRSAFEISDEQGQMIARELHEQFGGALDLAFETAPELIGGIALTVGDHEIAWSLQSYMETLEEQIEHIFAEETRSEATTAAEQATAEAAETERELVEGR